MNPESDFQTKKMVEYLESVHMGEFITGSLKDVKQNMGIAELDDDYKNPMETLPIPPPPNVTRMSVENVSPAMLLVHGKLN
jgi:hypothetical protein